MVLSMCEHLAAVDSPIYFGKNIVRFLAKTTWDVNGSQVCGSWWNRTTTRGPFASIQATEILWIELKIFYFFFISTLNKTNWSKDCLSVWSTNFYLPLPSTENLEWLNLFLFFIPCYRFRVDHSWFYRVFEHFWHPWNNIRIFCCIVFRIPTVNMYFSIFQNMYL